MAHSEKPADNPRVKGPIVLSVLVPAHNEEGNIAGTVGAVASVLRKENIPFEILVIDDNSSDGTADVVQACQGEMQEVRLLSKGPPSGLGRAIRYGLPEFRGDAIAIVMADMSDDPDDLVRCYRKLEEGFDCVFGSRFLSDSIVSEYPPFKLIFNRLGNHVIRALFMTKHNDLTNAFKLYRRHVIEGISPLYASHFNITIEMSLSALIRQYTIATIPINWSGRKWGQSKLRIHEMGRRYIATLSKIWFERLLILDDLMAEIASSNEKPWSRP